MLNLIELATAHSGPTNPATWLAAAEVYRLYERYFEPLRPILLLELGVNRGESLKTWSAGIQV